MKTCFFEQGKRSFWLKCFLLIVCLFYCWFIFVDENRIYQDDYYDAINKEVLSKNHLEGGKNTWSAFSLMQDRADSEMDQVFFDVLNANKLGDDEEKLSKVRVVYENALDIEKRAMEGLGILSNYIDRVNNVSTISDLVSVISLIERDLGIAILSNVVVDSDFEDTGTNMVYLYPVTFAFGTSVDYYVDDNYMTYKAYLKRAMIQILEVYGYSRVDAREVVSNLISFYEDVGSVSKTMLELSDVSSYFNRISNLDLQGIYTNLSVNDYLSEFGISGVSFYSLVDVLQYEKLNSYLDVSHLDLWKSHILVMILSHYVSYLSEDYEQVVVDLNQAIVGSGEEKTREERSKDLVVSLFSSEFDFIYEKRLVDDLHKKYLYEMFSDIKDVYRKMLENNEWLSEETIRFAIEKLDSMKIYVGMDSVEKDFSSLDEMNLLSDDGMGSLLQNVLEVIKVRRSMDLERLKNNVEKRVVGESVVNAYYSPMKNAIYVPSAAMFMMDLDDSYYENLGKIGMVIAHEITHGFDWNGSQFDMDGNFKNWWTIQDRKNFSDLKDRVINYYSSYEVLNGRFIDGKLTVNENIADLGAVRCISLIALEKDATISEKKEMYSSFAKFWVNQSSDEYVKLLLLQDTHAPNKYRVNAVLSSLDEFYDLYNISFFDDMYVKKENRVMVW